MEKEIARVLVAEEEIRKRVAELGARIAKDFAGQELLCVGILRGAFLFLADLVREIRLPVEVEFASNPAPIRGRHVLLDKPARRATPFEADYRGFEIGDEFVVGYGMDYGERYRNLPYIGVLGTDLKSVPEKLDRIQRRPPKKTSTR